MPELDLTPLRSILAEYAPKGRPGLIPALHAAQAIYGYLPQPVAAEVGRTLGVPLAEVYGVIDFYAMFYREPVVKTVVHVCDDPACAIAGAESVYNMLTYEYSQEASGAPSAITVERAPCLGLCEHAPALMVKGIQRGKVNHNGNGHLIEEIGEKPYGIIAGDISYLTANCGKRRATSLEEYVASGGYQSLKKALGMAPAAIIAEVKASGLVGRGGAAFPTGLKWEGAANAPGEPKYVVCNADEAEPGTFKDRVLMEEDPQRILEGLIIAAYAVGAHQGVIFIRGEYTNAFQIMGKAVAQARQAGFIGKNILGSGYDFDVELFRSAGAYICGEETALFEAVEGKRGFPRMKPPFPTTNGLFNKPTAINNVETLCNVPLILSLGAAEYRKIGTEKSPGPKLFCLSGDVERPGLYEVPFGIPIRHLIYDLGGGIRTGRKLQAILFGGAAGAFATEKDLDVRMSFEDLRAAGLPLGSGVVTVFDETRDLRAVLLRLARFFAEESCGKCYPCQLGTQRQYEITQRVASSEMLAGDNARLSDIAWTMTDASLCGLGQTAASAVMSAMKIWPEMFVESHP
ncbi:MAG: NAD(P)H-dependent oxidoreductase subunit E [Chloroflexi bacterium]|nr:NAD(P)H-dependent oxidoreductase subunit E [Chloroflexota bacterium]